MKTVNQTKKLEGTLSPVCKDWLWCTKPKDTMIDIQIQDMMDSGAHFGHQTKRWNPKMKPYIYGARSGIHIIDLQKTKDLAHTALKFVTETVAAGKNVLFVGSKPQAREIVKGDAERSSMLYVNDRWMGGTLTNFQTIKKSIDRLIDFETRRANNDFAGYTKRELLDIDRKIIKLLASLGGIKAMTQLPGCVFIVDPHLEKIAVTEATILGVPIVALTDTNCDPDPIEHVIPGNDDAISSIQYFSAKVAEACLAGLERREQNAQRGDEATFKRGPAPRRRAPGAKPDKTAYVSKGDSFEGDATGGFSAQVSEPSKAEAPKVEPAKTE